MALAGTGTQADPYLIVTLADLREFSENPTGQPYNNTGKYTRVESDIDATTSNTWNGGEGFIPVGAFFGTFDGNEKSIKNLFIRRGSFNIAMFTQVMFGATVRKLSLVNPNVSSSGSNVASLVGTLRGTISQCIILGGVVNATGGNWHGTLVGIMTASSDEYPLVVNCYSTCQLRGVNTTSGGLIGGVYHENAVVRNSYFAGTIVNSGGGLCGSEGNGSCQSSYYDSTIALKVDTNRGSLPKTTTQMKTQSTFAGWDFTNVWKMNAGEYPSLRAFAQFSFSSEPTTPRTIKTNQLFDVSWTVSDFAQPNISWKLFKNGMQIRSEVAGAVFSFGNVMYYGEDGEYYVTANDGTTTITSAVVTVVHDEIPIVYGEHSVDISLAFEIIDGWGAYSYVHDYGQIHDEYKTSCQMFVNDNVELPVNISNVPKQLNENGFFPFGPHVLGDSFGYTVPKSYRGKMDGIGIYHAWEVEMYPKTGEGITVKPWAWVPSASSNFNFGALVGFRTPICEPISEQNVHVNQSGNVVREYDFGVSKKARKCKMIWKELLIDEASVLVSYILTGLRSTTISVDFGDLAIANAWNILDSEAGSIFTSRLSSKKVNIKHSGSKWSVEIEISFWPYD